MGDVCIEVKERVSLSVPMKCEVDVPGQKFVVVGGPV